jgi:hypothetical protein
MHVSAKSRVSPTVLSGALIAFQILWCASIYAFRVANRSSKDGVSAAPLWAMGVLLLVPLSTMILGPWLVRARRVDGQRLQAVDYCALVLGSAPLAYMGFLFLSVFFER